MATSASSDHAHTRAGHEAEAEDSDEATKALRERLKSLREQRDALTQTQTEEGEGPATGVAAMAGPDHPEHLDARAWQDGEVPREPSDDRRSRGRRMKVLSAVGGVVAVILIALPFLTHGKGSTDGASKVSAADSTTSPEARSSLAGVPGGLETASPAPKKPADKSKSTKATSPSAGTAKHTSPTGRATAQAEIPEHVEDDAGTKTPAPVVIKPVAKLRAATSWKSERLQLGMQADGNLVLYDRQEKRVMWAAGTSGSKNVAAFQDDGNLVIRTAAGQAIWASNPAGFTNATLVIQPDGNVVIRAGGKQVWATNTHI
ncbi:hypothetical protein ACIREO_32150 [Streptomyces sp. NPDC102441]|uniref:hypothetical protein n=1 Tax=Streptomyces sp. NPDC102441 TaxID=3366176 RepID=UPI00380B17CF